MNEAQTRAQRLIRRALETNTGSSAVQADTLAEYIVVSLHRGGMLVEDAYLPPEPEDDQSSNKVVLSPNLQKNLGFTLSPGVLDTMYNYLNTKSSLKKYIGWNTTEKSDGQQEPTD